MKKGLKMSKKEKKALYGIHEGEFKIITYNPNFKCLCCGLPIKNASEMGTMVCFTCGKCLNRNLEPWSKGESIYYFHRFLYSIIQYIIEEITEFDEERK